MLHSTFLNNLPNIHKDPFDRILIAQSILEKIPLITNDEFIKSYPDIELIW
jgi:PIN domain nuclease of toxin-antitoxin system